MNTKETPPPTSFRRFSSIDFSSLPKSSMSTPLNSKTNGIPNRMKPPKIVDQTPIVRYTITENEFTEDEDNNPDQSVLEALDVSYKDWKVTWSEESGKPSKKKRKLDWSVEDEAIIEKFNETRKKFCSRISTRPFETIKECPMEEYQEAKGRIDSRWAGSLITRCIANLVNQEEELLNQNEISKRGNDESSVQIIDEKTLLDDNDEADETMTAQEKIKPKISKEATRHGGRTIFLDDTEDKHRNSEYETSIENGEIDDYYGNTELWDEIFRDLAKGKVEPERNFGASTSYFPKGTKVHHDFHGRHARLRPIVIDGSNVAYAHGKSEPAPENRRNVSEFSCWGIKLVVDYFVKRGHDNIVAFVPEFRKKSGKSRDGQVLDKLEKDGHLAFTPSREVNGRFIASHDDGFILGYAAKHGGIVITRDNFKDHYHVREWRDTIEKRLLQPTFFRGELIQFPDDPMGRNGVSLDQFLKFEN